MSEERQVVVRLDKSVGIILVLLVGALAFVAGMRFGGRGVAVVSSAGSNSFVVVTPDGAIHGCHRLTDGWHYKRLDE